MDRKRQGFSTPFPFLGDDEEARNLRRAAQRLTFWRSATATCAFGAIAFLVAFLVSDFLGVSRLLRSAMLLVAFFMAAISWRPIVIRNEAHAMRAMLKKAGNRCLNCGFRLVNTQVGCPECGTPRELDE
jgi:hypothetical protein